MSDTSSSSETAVEIGEVPVWKQPKVTEASLEWADILTVDLSLFETRRSSLVETVSTALQRDGFFYVVGHGIEKVWQCFSLQWTSTELITFLLDPAAAGPAI